MGESMKEDNNAAQATDSDDLNKSHGERIFLWVPLPLLLILLAARPAAAVATAAAAALLLRLLCRRRRVIPLRPRRLEPSLRVLLVKRLPGAIHLGLQIERAVLLVHIKEVLVPLRAQKGE